MFKNFIAYRIAPLWPADLGAIEQALTKGQFTPCGAKFNNIPEGGLPCGH
jgi:DNA recombination-dependent growth factor C